MKPISSAAKFLLSLTLAIASTGALADPSPCSVNGEFRGRKTAESFCELLEMRYTQDALPVKAFPIPVRICEEALATSCRNSMDQLLGEKTLCRQLVAANWNNSSDSFGLLKKASCPFPNDELPPETCPQGTIRVHRERFCYNGQQYIGFVYGQWLTFVNNQETNDGTRLYIFSQNGTTLYYRFGDLTPVEL